MSHKQRAVVRNLILLWRHITPPIRNEGRMATKIKVKNSVKTYPNILLVSVSEPKEVSFHQVYVITNFVQQFDSFSFSLHSGGEKDIFKFHRTIPQRSLVRITYVNFRLEFLPIQQNYFAF